MAHGAGMCVCVCVIILKNYECFLFVFVCMHVGVCELGTLGCVGRVD